MRVKVDEISRINKMIEERASRSDDVKLLSLNLLDELGDIERVSKILKVPESTLYEWLREWNEKKEIKNNQGQGGGRPRALNKEQLEELKNKLMAANISTTKGVRLLIKKIFNIDYSARQISRILRGLGMTLQKPYPHDYRRPYNAEVLLQNQLSLTFEVLKKKWY